MATSGSFANATLIDFMDAPVAEDELIDEDLSGTISSMVGAKQPKRPNMQRVDLHTDFDTLEEPVRDTIMRDLRTVGAKFGHVIMPGNSDRKELLKEWDLWGPLFICVCLSLLLHSSGNGESAPQFTQVFTLTFFGSIIVTMNIKLLGGDISFFQCVCVLGYCLLPSTLSAVICSILLHSKLFLLRLLLTGASFLWATYAAMGFLAESQPSKRRLLVVYPLFLFYFVISWLVLSHT